MDFNEFCKTKIEENKKENVHSSGISEDDIKNRIKNYENFSKDELVNELLRETKRAKENGTFSREKIQDFVKTVEPMLSEEQRISLQNILKMII